MKYTVVFLVAALALTVVAVATFDRIEATLRANTLAARPSFPPGDTLPAPVRTSPVIPTRADYAAFAAADSAWRAEHARRYTVAELRRRGDGQRTTRERMQDRVFEYTKNGRRRSAIAELERWVAAHPRDSGALLSLARLLNADGQADAAIVRYRQVLALGGSIGDVE
jgi:tetratricopeptide (TPR) repeat protein